MIWSEFQMDYYVHVSDSLTHDFWSYMPLEYKFWLYDRFIIDSHTICREVID